MNLNQESVPNYKGSLNSPEFFLEVIQIIYMVAGPPSIFRANFREIFF
jgi:hypothetical protein